MEAYRRYTPFNPEEEGRQGSIAMAFIGQSAPDIRLRQPPDRWLSNARVTHYQSLLLNKDKITFGPPVTLNPATLLPEEASEPVLHTCQDVLAEEAGVRPDLLDCPLPNAEVTYFTDGSSFLIQDTFSGWTEAFPTKKETAAVVTKKLMEEIFPRFGLPKVIGSDNGPAFVAKVSQGLANILGIDWKLHCAYRPESSGQVERMNRTIKETLTKLAHETGLKDWTMLLPYALFRARNTPSTKPPNLTPFEILFGTPPPIRDLTPLTEHAALLPTSLSDRLIALDNLQRDVWTQLASAYAPSEFPAPHPYQVGDFVFVRRHQQETLQPRWKGPYQVLLTTPTAVKVDGVASWVHASHLKPASAPEDGSWELKRSDNPLKLKLSRKTL
nr:uncharacterized protein LOC111753573 [Cavia porcellus]